MTSPAPASAAYRYYVVIILVLVNTVNFIDRQAISILAPSIQEEFQISNTLLGLVMGIAFTAFYATLGFPIAKLADRRNRTTILAGVLVIWSGMTALCGAAGSFVQLFLFRIGVGIGEAGAGPCSHSLLADYFSKKDRPAVLGYFSLGVPFGVFLGIVLGGLLVEELGWRWTFVVLGAPGVVLAIIVKLTVREPVRGGTDDLADAALLRASEDVSIREGIRLLWSVRTYRIMSYSAALSALCGYGVNLWAPGFLTRIHDLQPGELALPLGLATGIGGGLGASLGGFLTSRAAARDPRAFLSLPALTMVVFGIALAIAVWTPSLTLSYFALTVVFFTQFFLMGPFFGVVQRLAPLRGRAVATAFFFFILASVGLGLGPLYVGAMNDVFGRWVGDAEGLRLSLATLPVISLVAAAIAYFGRGSVARDLAARDGLVTPA
jgi:MFS family permease